MARGIPGLTRRAGQAARPGKRLFNLRSPRTYAAVQRVRLLAQHQHKVPRLRVHCLAPVALKHQAVALARAPPAGQGGRGSGSWRARRGRWSPRPCQEVLQPPAHLMMACTFVTDRNSAPSGRTRRRSTATVLVQPALSLARDTNTCQEDSGRVWPNAAPLPSRHHPHPHIHTAAPHLVLQRRVLGGLGTLAAQPRQLSDAAAHERRLLGGQHRQALAWVGLLKGRPGARSACHVCRQATWLSPDALPCILSGTNTRPCAVLDSPGSRALCRTPPAAPRHSAHQTPRPPAGWVQQRGGQVTAAGAAALPRPHCPRPSDLLELVCDGRLLLLPLPFVLVGVVQQRQLLVCPPDVGCRRAPAGCSGTAAVQRRLNYPHSPAPGLPIPPHLLTPSRS